MSVLIEEAREVANGLAGEGLTFVSGLMRRLADALDMQRIELASRAEVP